MMEEVGKKMAEMNTEMNTAQHYGEDASHHVLASCNGLGAPLSIRVSEETISLGASAVSAACLEAMQNAHRKAQQEMMSKLQSMLPTQ